MAGKRQLAKENFYRLFLIDAINDAEVQEQLIASGFSERIISALKNYAFNERNELLKKNSDKSELEYELNKIEALSNDELNNIYERFDAKLLIQVLTKKAVEIGDNYFFHLSESLQFNEDFESLSERSGRENLQSILAYLNEKINGESDLWTDYDKRFYSIEDLTVRDTYKNEAKFIANNYAKYLQLLQDGQSQNNACKLIEEGNYSANTRNDYQKIDIFFSQLDDIIGENVEELDDIELTFSNDLKSLILTKAYKYSQAAI